MVLGPEVGLSVETTFRVGKKLPRGGDWDGIVELHCECSSDEVSGAGFIGQLRSEVHAERTTSAIAKVHGPVLHEVASRSAWSHAKRTRCHVARSLPIRCS